jgi:isopenicillin-N N-acyltransferase-like protein
VGIAATSGTDECHVLGLNLMDEEWWLREVMRGDRRLDHCTSMAHWATDGEPTLLAQNMDLPAWLDGHQVLLDVSPIGEDEGSRAAPCALVPSHAGMIGLNALNEYGVGVTVNALPQLPTSADGLPVAFVIRLLATQSDLASVLAVAQRIPHTTGQNYTIGSPVGAVSLECSAAGATRYDPGGRTIAHSNHPLDRAACRVCRMATPASCCLMSKTASTDCSTRRRGSTTSLSLSEPCSNC